MSDEKQESDESAPTTESSDESNDPQPGSIGKIDASRFTEQKELRFPVILIVVAIAILLALEYSRSHGLKPVIPELDSFSYLLHALANTVFGLITCYVVGYFLGTSFGSFKIGFFKLTATVIFSLTIGLALMKLSPLLGLPLSAGFDLGGVFTFSFSPPIVLGFIAAAVLFYGFLQSFFRLEVQEIVMVMVVQLLVALGTRTSVHNVLELFG